MAKIIQGLHQAGPNKTICSCYYNQNQ
jgi:hypothetical protein